ncbi:CaiB/BaiF CoA-transferase family protein [Neobacillus sp. 179-J 1A1 HS]|jgi:CoA:oxalate CoA-transferase|uniref:CaiB/BaiF CoA transferase family protein n=1 Tax=Neobacillus driksii TaxID=3035913 RepID=UPI0035BBA54E
MNSWNKNLIFDNKTASSIKPLEGILVIDFSQFLSGPSAGLRLADLGARVIKIERPDSGDICRTLYISNVELDGDSSIFHAINRNKDSFGADLKHQTDIDRIKELIKQADVIIQNFRPGVMERLGLDYQHVKRLNPGVVYAEITGYGSVGPWVEAPGQDLLVQSRSGLTWLAAPNQKPAPFGLAIVDMAAGVHLAQGILAALVQKSITGVGAHIEVSLLESILDFQFRELTEFLNRENQSFKKLGGLGRSIQGIYQTADGYLALTALSLESLREWIGEFQPTVESLEIGQMLSSLLKTKTSQEWISQLSPPDLYCEEVLPWDELFKEEGFKMLDMIQKITRTNGHSILTTRCPITIDGQIYKSEKGSPKVGETTNQILNELLQKKEEV